MAGQWGGLARTWGATVFPWMIAHGKSQRGAPLGRPARSTHNVTAAPSSTCGTKPLARLSPSTPVHAARIVMPCSRFSASRRWQRNHCLLGSAPCRSLSKRSEIQAAVHRRIRFRIRHNPNWAQPWTSLPRHSPVRTRRCRASRFSAFP